MEYNSYIILFFFNLLFYIACFLIIFQRENYSAFSIRSPQITILSNIASFLITSSFIAYEMIEDFEIISDYNFSFCNFIPFCFILFHLMVFFSFAMRISCLLQCGYISSMLLTTNKLKAKTFYSQRLLSDQKFYLKLFTVIILFFGIFIFLFYFFIEDNIPIPYHFIKCPCNNDSLKYTTYMIYNFVYFIESIILITFFYKFIFTSFKMKIKVEFYVQIVAYILYFHLTKYLLNEKEEPFHNTSILVLLLNYIFTICNTIVPFVISIIDKVKTSYHFNPKLASNLYLFLSDEICYYSFSNFMKGNPRNDFYISLYIQIMKFKYKYTLDFDYYRVLDDGKALYENYFSPKANNIFMSDDLLTRIRNGCAKMLNEDECSYEQFDEALVNVYDVLENKFKEYRKSDDYHMLVDNLNLYSYVQYKMFSVSKRQKGFTN